MKEPFPSRSLASVGVSVLDCEHKTPAAAHDGYPYIAIPEIQDGSLDLKNVRRITEADYLEWTKRTRPTAGDVIVTRRARVGHSAAIPQGLDCAIGQNLVLLRSNGEHVDQAYLRWAALSPLWWSEVERLINVGAVFDSLNVRDISKIRIPVPDLEAQQAIAEVLGALDDKIAANAKLSRTTSKYLAALFEESTAGSDWTTLGEVAAVNEMTVRPTPGGNLRYVDISSVMDGTILWPEPISWDDAPGRARRGLSEGDTIWSTVRPNRRSHALVLSPDPKLVASTGLAVISARSCGFAFLYQATDTLDFSSYLENVAEGSAYPAVKADRFLAAPIPWPEAEVRQDFEGVAAPLRRQQYALDAENQTLAATRDALLPQLMAGKLRVKEAEALVAEAC